MSKLQNDEILMHWPTAPHRITAGWLYSDGSAHSALDFGVPTGTPVYAAEGGTVAWLQVWNGSTAGSQSYGNAIRLRHSSYRGKRLETLYAHLRSIAVQSGQQVAEGQLIGYSGSTGNSTGPHLHFEVRVNGTRVNPLNWLDADFYPASPAVRLGSYTSVQRTAAPALVTLTIGPASAGDAEKFSALAQELKVACRSTGA